MALTEKSWPRHITNKIDTRKRDVVVRITDWTKDRDEPAYDVEMYIRGVYDWNESKVFSTKGGKTKAKAAAVAFAQAQIAKHL